MKNFVMLLVTLMMISQSNYAQQSKGKKVQKTERPSIFREFSQSHDWVMRREGVYQATMDFVAKGSSGKLETERAMLVMNKTGKVIYLVQKGKPRLLLNHDLGTWITDEEQPSPLKISGSFVVYGVINVDDVIGLDLRKTYRIEKDMGNKVLLKGRKKGATYPYMLLKKLGRDKFEAEFKDHTQKSVKKGVFELGTVNGIKVIKKATYRDLVIDTKRYTTYEFLKVFKSKIPALALDPERFKMIFAQLKLK